MHRFYAPEIPSTASTVSLAGDEAHHAVHVLRVRKGERVSLLNGKGDEFLCDVVEPSKKSLQLTVVEVQRSPAPLSSITLIQGIPKGKIIESFIQKATELGVSRVVPLLSERVVTHLDNDSAEDKREKWQRVAIEACKQCGQRWLPKIDAPITTKDFLARAEKFGFAVVGSLERDARHLREYFAEQKSPNTVAVWIGPEGDFSPAEYAAIRQSGAHPITFGPLVLRSETAATYALSIVSYELRVALV
ncbi:MAG: rsmE [Verrucomicrobiales bacterium]|nr:rsmE [Verrucomicrobiales bacterium]